MSDFLQRRNLFRRFTGDDLVRHECPDLGGTLLLEVIGILDIDFPRIGVTWAREDGGPYAVPAKQDAEDAGSGN